jgi:hypothetical protein
LCNVKGSAGEALHLQYFMLARTPHPSLVNDPSHPPPPPSCASSFSLSNAATDLEA